MAIHWDTRSLEGNADASVALDKSLPMYDRTSSSTGLGRDDGEFGVYGEALEVLSGGVWDVSLPSIDGPSSVSGDGACERPQSLECGRDVIRVRGCGLFFNSRMTVSSSATRFRSREFSSDSAR